MSLMLERIHGYSGVDPSASVHPSVRFDGTVTISPGAVVGADVTLGRNVVVYPGTEIGEGCVVFDQAVLGRPPLKPVNRGRPAEMDLPPLVVGEGCVIGACTVVYQGTSIGDNTLIGDGAAIREDVRIGREVLIAMGVTINYTTEIGDRTRIMDNTHITGNCVIESDVFIAMNVSTTNDNGMARAEESDVEFTGPRIERGASVGGGAVLLPDVVIGREAVVAAGAVVTRNVDPGTVVMGVPARPLARGD